MNGTVTLLDGGMGQELVRRHRSSTGREPTTLWSSTVLSEAPELVTGLHLDYIRAGAEVITLASYSATPERLARDGLGDRFATLQEAAADCAERARDTAGQAGVRLAACLPPLVASYRADLVPDRDRLRRSYDAIVALQRERCDLMLCETMSSIVEAEIAAGAALESGRPVWVALTVEDQGGDVPPRLRGGEPVGEAAERLDALGVSALLLNCSTPEAIGAALPSIASPGRAFGGYANAFRSIDALARSLSATVDVLERREDLDPDGYARAVIGWVEQGATLIGGCCETTPAHVQRLRERLSA